MWSIFRKRSADIAKAKEEAAKKSNELRTAREAYKQTIVKGPDDRLKNARVKRLQAQQQAKSAPNPNAAPEEDEKKLPEGYVLPEKMSPFTDNPTHGDVMPLEIKPQSYRIPDPTNPHGYDLFTGNAFPKRPDRFSELTRKTAFEDAHAPFKIFVSPSRIL